MLDSGLLVLLAFLPLTKGGKEPDNIEQMIERLIAANEIDLLAISYPLGGLVFNKEPEREWFNRRFNMLQDVLKDSWVYQELIEEGRQEARQQELRRLRQILVDIVLGRFPKIEPQAQKYIEMIDDLALLQSLIVHVSLAQSAQEVMQLFGSANDDEQS
jgi:hypothetical protein